MDFLTAVKASIQNWRDWLNLELPDCIANSLAISELPGFVCTCGKATKSANFQHACTLLCLLAPSWLAAVIAKHFVPAERHWCLLNSFSFCFTWKHSMVDVCLSYCRKSLQSVTYTFIMKLSVSKGLFESIWRPKAAVLFLRSGQIWAALTQLISHQDSLWSQLASEMV